MPDRPLSELNNKTLLWEHRISHVNWSRGNRGGNEATADRAKEAIRWFLVHNAVVKEMLRRGMNHRSPIKNTRASSPRALRKDMQLCRGCPAYGKYVPPEGPKDAEIALVGESPGKEEAEAGRPFVGAAGQRLMKILEKLGKKREEVYLTNAVKCYVASGRIKTAMVIACRPWLQRELAMLKPKRVIALGNVALLALGGRAIRAPHPVARIRGVAEKIRKAIGGPK